MSKTILQEIATFNAATFNSSQLQKEISDQGIVIEDFYDSTVDLINDNESNFKLIAEKIKQEFSDNSNLINIELDKNKLLVSTLEDFTIKEISENYKNLGVIKQEFRRNDDKLGDRIDQQYLNTLEYYAGPVSTVTLDTNLNPIGYSVAKAESLRNWMYISGRIIKYQGHDLFNLNSLLDTITVGKTTTEADKKSLIITKNLTINENLDLTNGKLTITSPVAVTESITVNKSIHSTAGAVIATTGLSTTNGNITTGTGDITTTDGNIQTSKGFIKTLLGDISTTSGNIKTLAGSLSATTGVSTSSGNISTGSGAVTATTGLSTTGGDISTAAGAVTATTGLSTTGGDISTGIGNVLVSTGNIKTSSGTISTDSGNIKTLSGNIFSVDGKFWIGGSTSVWLDGTTKMLLSGDDLRIAGKLTTGGALVASSLSTTGDISGANLTLSGIVTSNGIGTNTFNGPVTTKAMTCTTLTTTGAATLGSNVSIAGTLAVTGTTTFSSDVYAYGKTIYATTFNGNATSANYADVAEKYLCNSILLPGTVVSLSTDENYEIELYNENLPLAGVVSTAPGVRLNENSNTEDAHWLLIALVGRIPVRVSNNVKKGMYLIPDQINHGQAIGIYKNEITTNDMLNLIGVAISNSSNGFVEAKV